MVDARVEIDNCTDAIRTLLQGPVEYPSWLPIPLSWDADNAARITSLRIPQTSQQANRQGDPDMILYHLGHLEDLDPSFEARMRQFTAGNHHTLLVNASGSGKTRMALEVLYRHWGFYLGADIDYIANPYGSEDFPNLVSDVSGLVRHVPLTPRKERLSLLERNRAVVASHMRQTMLARLLVLDHFVTLARQSGIDDAEARAKWLWLQLRPTEFVGCDIFRSVHTTLYRWSEDALSTQLHDLVNKHKNLLEFMVIDEAQITVIKNSYSFVSSDHRMHQPLLHALVTHLASLFPSSRCIVSGTEVPFSIMEDAISLSDHSIKTVRPFTSLGDFGDLERTSSYLRHFLGSDLSAEECALAHHWLRGRHRMLSVLVTRTLRFGRARYTTILDSIVRTTTGFDPHTRSTGAMIGVGLMPVVRDENLEDTDGPSAALRSAAYIYVTHGVPATFTADCTRLVGTGLARFGDSIDSATVDEPIMLLNLARWLHTSRGFSTTAIIRRRLRDPSEPVRGLALAEAFAFSLWKSFGTSGFRLDQLVRFPGKAPTWAARRATFCLTSTSEGTRAFRKCSANPTSLVRAARDIEDVLDWFSDSRTPFLIPDSDFGAQLIFVLSIPPSHRLVIVHLDPFPRDRPHRHNCVVPRDPTKLYSHNRLSQAKFLTVLSSFTRTQRSSTRSTAAYSSLETLQIYCFADLYKPEHVYDPPIVTMQLRDLISREQLVELTPADLAGHLP